MLYLWSEKGWLLGSIPFHIHNNEVYTLSYI